MKLRSKKKTLGEEKRRLIDLIKKLQDAYLNKGEIETRVYENTMKSYTTRLIDVEERMTFLEAQKAMSKEKWWGKLLKSRKKRAVTKAAEVKKFGKLKKLGKNKKKVGKKIRNKTAKKNKSSKHIKTKK